MGQDQTRQALIQDLVDTLPDTIEALDYSIENIDQQLEYLTDDWYGVSAVMSMMTTAAQYWMETKASQLDITFVVETSGNWGILNLTQWGIVDPNAPPGGVNYNQYLDTDVTSGAPSATETQQYNRQIDFPVAYDHIHHSIGLDGTYGILDKISGLNKTRSLQVINRNAYKGFLKSYDRNKDI